MVMGCDFGQGVLIAPPVPQERFLDLLRQRVSKPAAATSSQNGSASPQNAMHRVA
jgi:hypothetical protein